MCLRNVHSKCKLNKRNSSRVSFILDSGASHNLTTTQTAAILQDVTPASPLQVQLPDGTFLESTTAGYLPIDGISRSCAHTRVVNGLEEPSLLSVAPFCDDGMSVLFTKEEATVRDASGQTVLRGPRNPASKLWEFHLDSQTGDHFAEQNNTVPTILANRIFHCPKEDDQLVSFFHRAMCTSKWLIRS